jgi:rRNA maturation endonuclease Nob1
MADINVINFDFKPDRQGIVLYQCNKCNGKFIETFSSEITEYEFCPICGIHFNIIKQPLSGSEQYNYIPDIGKKVE